LPDAALEALDLDIRFAQDRPGQAGLLIEECGEEVFDVDLLLAVADGATLRIRKGFLGFLG
jgi:hypothetical protein